MYIYAHIYLGIKNIRQPFKHRGRDMAEIDLAWSTDKRSWQA